MELKLPFDLKMFQYITAFKPKLLNYTIDKHDISGTG